MVFFKAFPSKCHLLCYGASAFATSAAMVVKHKESPLICIHISIVGISLIIKSGLRSTQEEGEKKF